jgi:hypothetical protein
MPDDRIGGGIEIEPRTDGTVATMGQAGRRRARQCAPTKLEALGSKLALNEKDRRANADLSPVSSVVLI